MRLDGVLIGFKLIAVSYWLTPGHVLLNDESSKTDNFCYLKRMLILIRL